jgi:hypothetical protein
MKICYYLQFVILIGISPLLFAQVDYQTQIQPIFNDNCTSCHGSNGGVDLRSYNALMNSIGNNYGTNVVVPGNPNASGLVDKIEPNPQFGNRMPNANGIPQSDINLIRQWISEGANEVATSNENNMQLPNAFKLLGNYPNPFNPSTHIKFELPESAQYSISVFTLTGRLLMEQVGYANAGVASISVDMKSNPTGTYLYQVSAVVNGKVNFIGTGRMTLIK